MMKCPEHPNTVMERVEFDTSGKTGWGCPDCRKEKQASFLKNFKRSDCEKATLSDAPQIDFKRVPRSLFKMRSGDEA